MLFPGKHGRLRELCRRRSVVSAGRGSHRRPMSSAPTIWVHSPGEPKSIQLLWTPAEFASGCRRSGLGARGLPHLRRPRHDVSLTPTTVITFSGERRRSADRRRTIFANPIRAEAGIATALVADDSSGAARFPCAPLRRDSRKPKCSLSRRRTGDASLKPSCGRVARLRIRVRGWRPWGPGHGPSPLRSHF